MATVADMTAMANEMAVEKLDVLMVMVPIAVIVTS